MRNFVEETGRDLSLMLQFRMWRISTLSISQNDSTMIRCYQKQSETILFPYGIETPILVGNGKSAAASLSSEVIIGHESRSSC
ncbi:hypothetical protein L1049_023273 [Liquidambar formosana]|uniref:Uncharacterized protein n=1 Tax=Liquidambar formosana TaxID=63359 RepID=A0AAP0RT22_LIQFO